MELTRGRFKECKGDMGFSGESDWEFWGRGFCEYG